MTKNRPLNTSSASPKNPWKFRVSVLVFMALAALMFVFFRHGFDQERGSREKDLTDEFGATVGPASEEFVTQTQAALAGLDAELREGFAGIAEEFAEICVNSDGVIARAKGEEEARRVLNDALRASVTDLITRSFENFHASASDARELLELRLLITTPLNDPFASTLERHSLQVQGYAPQPPVSALRGGGFAKTLDEGFAWVPLVGDAWDLGKLIFGDPRENGIRERARNFVHGEEAKWLAMVGELKKAAPDATATERNCRAAFQPKSALLRLVAE